MIIMLMLMIAMRQLKSLKDNVSFRGTTQKNL